MTRTIRTEALWVERQENSRNGNARWAVTTRAGVFVTKADSTVADEAAILRSLLMHGTGPIPVVLTLNSQGANGRIVELSGDTVLARSRYVVCENQLPRSDEYLPQTEAEMDAELGL